jgi:hypothetical protein
LEAHFFVLDAGKLIQELKIIDVSFYVKCVFLKINALKMTTLFNVVTVLGIFTIIHALLIIKITAFANIKNFVVTVAQNI